MDKFFAMPNRACKSSRCGMAVATGKGSKSEWVYGKRKSLISTELLR